MDKTEELLERCFKCKSYQENDCGIYFMMALWQKECKFFMETNYQEYLNQLDVIDWETFNKILNSFPKIEDFDKVIIDDNGVDDLCQALFDYFLEGYPHAYCEDIDFFSKEYSLYGSETLKELETIKNLFSDWKMINYEEELERFKEQEKEIEQEKLQRTLTNYINKAPIDKLHKLEIFINKL